jgi:hypothetical protein
MEHGVPELARPQPEVVDVLVFRDSACKTAIPGVFDAFCSVLVSGMHARSTIGSCHFYSQNADFARTTFHNYRIFQTS